MGPKFFQTRMGLKFYEGTLPKLVSAVEDVVKELKRKNELKEIELGIKEKPGSQG
jgi:hypothetical protein